MNEQPRYREISDPAVLALQPLVSVHMLAYRHERFLAEAIEGVVSQICDFPIELIIAEDCSPDETLNIALDYQRRHPRLIRVITGETNVGMHANSRRTMPAARGKYIAFCEGDDYWHHPRKMQMQVDLMSASPNMMLCHTDYDRKVGDRVKASRYKFGMDKPALSYLDALHGMTIKTATSLYRMSVLNSFLASSFHNASWPFGDHNLELFAASAGQLAYIPVSTATSRKVLGSATNSGAVVSLRMAVAALECREIFMKAFPVATTDIESVRRASYKRIIGCSFRAGDNECFSNSVREFTAHGGNISKFKLIIFQKIMKARYPLHIYRVLRTIILRILTD